MLRLNERLQQWKESMKARFLGWRERHIVKNINRELARLQIKEYDGELYVSFDGIPLHKAESDDALLHDLRAMRDSYKIYLYDREFGRL